MRKNRTKLPSGLAVVFLIAAWGCSRGPKLPSVGTAEYRETAASFYLGLAALQSGEDVGARKALTRATELAPGEPAAWVNLAILDARQQDYETAAQRLQIARKLAPTDSRIEELLGLVESRRGNVAEAIVHYRRAIELQESNLRAHYALAMETERAQGDALTILRRLLQRLPDNEAVLLDVARLAARQNNAQALNQAVAAMEPRAPRWPAPAQEYFQSLRTHASAGDFRNAAIQSQFLRNTLLRTPAFRAGLAEVRVAATAAGDPFLRFLKLPSPSAEPSPPDAAVRFVLRDVPDAPQGVRWAAAMHLNGETGPSQVWVDAAGLYVGRRRVADVPSNVALNPNSVISAALRDFQSDLVLATAAGVRLFHQFADVTAQTALPPEILRSPYYGAWALDFDLDGDLDVVLAAERGEPVVLRNNGDRTFAAVRPFRGVKDVRAFAAGDLDGDGVADVAMLDQSGALSVFLNDRLGAFRSHTPPAPIRTGNLAVAAGDINGDGWIDFVVLRTDGSVQRMDWSGAAPVAPAPARNQPEPRLHLADLDNNGSLDLVAGHRVLLGDGRQFQELAEPLPLRSLSIADVNGDGRLDAVGIDAGGAIAQWINRGVKSYGWQMVLPRAAAVAGDQRINAFAIGGEIEVRSGLLTQKQVIQSPVLHFGLGDRPRADFVRMVWPNGVVQAEFDLAANLVIEAPQRLKGSCPFLFTWDGTRMRFLKDVGPMSAPIGAHLDHDALEPIHSTRQWFHIGEDDLKARDGYYDLRLTNEYWETHYTDHYALQAVDYPENAHAFVDERVADPPVPLRLYVTGEPRPFARAVDDLGADVSALVRAKDERYLDTFGLGRYQGLTRDHWVELELPADAPRSGPLYLLASGFVHPWDETITMARVQGAHPAPQDLSLEAVSASGEWKPVQRSLGIPAGRGKTIVLDLSGAFAPDAPRRLRLRTNLEIYWDQITWAPGLPQNIAHLTPLPLQSAELRYRGYSLLSRRSRTSPELADYSIIARTTPAWRDLEGYYTRYGDVRELLEATEGRMAIVNSGDELRMRFSEMPPPAKGFRRSFLFVSDGWIKEGDYNFRLSRTVGPLPYHGMRNYTAPWTPLESDPVYLRHPDDWRNFHTRYITAEPFNRALWSR